MKKLNFIIKYGLALLLLSFYSCESWLNVTPSDRLSEEMLFNDREGFVKALNGVYIELNTNELYGRNLTAGALDVMGQYYSVASSSHAFYNYGGLVYTGNDEPVAIRLSKNVMKIKPDFRLSGRGRSKGRLWL